jgi:hypothetical protein
VLLKQRHAVSWDGVAVGVEAWEDRVVGAWEKAQAKRAPRAAKASRRGVPPSGPPQAPTASARVVSRVMSTIVGPATVGGASSPQDTLKSVRLRTAARVAARRMARR